MIDLLARDTNKILDIQLFVLGNYVSIETKRGDIVYPGDRISITYGVMNSESLIKSEIEGRKGRTVVSLCTNDETSHKIREIVRRMLDKDIYLKELDFRPYSPRGHNRRLNNALNREKSKGIVRSV